MTVAKVVSPKKKSERPKRKRRATKHEVIKILKTIALPNDLDISELESALAEFNAKLKIIGKLDWSARALAEDFRKKLSSRIVAFKRNLPKKIKQRNPPRTSTIVKTIQPSNTITPTVPAIPRVRVIERPDPLVVKPRYDGIRISSVDPLSPKFLESFEWKDLRIKILMVFGRRCMCCGATPESGEVMHVDHIKPRKNYPHLALDETNLQILCGTCNHGKGNKDEDMYDFRPSNWKQLLTESKKF